MSGVKRTCSMRKTCRRGVKKKVKSKKKKDLQTEMGRTGR
jgi:hypothetical protein